VANIEHFSGPSFDRDDAERLGRQLRLVRDFMLRQRKGQFATLREISQAVGCSECSASARLRDLRKRGLVVERRRLSRGLHGYRVQPPAPEQLPMPWETKVGQLERRLATHE
jgi:biotin operon repressor